MTTMKRIATILILIAAPLCAQLPQAISLYEQERYEEARKILAPMRDDPDALFLLGKIALQQEDDENAVSLLQKAAKLKPANADIHYWLALANREVMMHSSFFKQPSIAKKLRAEPERAIEIDP